MAGYENWFLHPFEITRLHSCYANMKNQKDSDRNIPPGGLRKVERCCIMGKLITDFYKGELHEPYTGASKEE